MVELADVQSGHFHAQITCELSQILFSYHDFLVFMQYIVCVLHLRQAKVDKIADYIPELEVLGDEDADLLIVGWGGTYGHLRLAVFFGSGLMYWK